MPAAHEMFHLFQYSTPLHSFDYTVYHTIKMNALSSLNDNLIDGLFGSRRSIHRVEYPCSSLEADDNFDLRRSERFMSVRSTCKSSIDDAVPEAKFETLSISSSRKRTNETEHLWVGSPTCRLRLMARAGLPVAQLPHRILRRIFKSPSHRARRPDVCRQPSVVFKKQASNDFESYYEDRGWTSPALVKYDSICTTNQRADSIIDLDFKIDLQSNSSSQTERKLSKTPINNCDEGLGFDHSAFQKASDQVSVFAQCHADGTLLANSFTKAPFKAEVDMIADKFNYPCPRSFDFYQLPLNFANDETFQPCSPYSRWKDADFEMFKMSSIETTTIESNMNNGLVSARRVRIGGGRTCKVHSPAKSYKNYLNGDKLPVYKCRGCQSGIACDPGEIENVFCTVCEVHTRANKEHFSGYYLCGSELLLANNIEPLLIG